MSESQGIDCVFIEIFLQRMAIENERGNPRNPLKITWLEGTKVQHDSGHGHSTTTVATPMNVCESSLANLCRLDSYSGGKTRVW